MRRLPITTTMLATLVVAATLAAPAEGAVPVNVTPPRATGSPVVGATVRTTVGEWSGSPVESVIQWWRCIPAPSFGCTPSAIAGATGETYVITDGDLTGDVYPVVSARNADGWSEGLSGGGIGPVAATPTGPVSTGAPRVSGQMVAGGTLTASTGTWSTTPDAYAFAWFYCDPTVDFFCREIQFPGAERKAYRLADGDERLTIWATVAAHDASGWSQPVRSENWIEGAGGGSAPAPVLDPTVRDIGAATTRRRAGGIVLRPGIRVTCAAGDPCYVIVSARTTILRDGRRRRITVGNVERILPGASAFSVAFRLTAPAARLLRTRSRFSTRLTVSARIMPRPPVTLRKKVTVRRPPRAR